MSTCYQENPVGYYETFETVSPKFGFSYWIKKLFNLFLLYQLRCHPVWSRHLSMHVNLFHSFRLHTDMDSACKELRSSTIKNCPTPRWRQTKSRHRGWAASDWQFTQGNGVKVLLFSDINCIVVLVFCLSQHNCYCDALKFKCTERYWALLRASFWFLSMMFLKRI